MQKQKIDDEDFSEDDLYYIDHPFTEKELNYIYSIWYLEKKPDNKKIDLI